MVSTRSVAASRGDRAQRGSTDLRLFVGLYPPGPVLQALPRRTDREHVTLAFLGEVDDPAPLRSGLERVAGLPAPRLRLAGAGRFRGSAVWLGLAGDLAALHALHAAVGEVVGEAGLRVDTGRWQPHLTVGRGRLPPDLLAYEGPEAAWHEVALVQSRLGHDGARHEKLSTYGLAVPGS